MSGISMSPTRRELLAASAAAGAISMLPETLRASTTGDSIQPFSVNFPQDDLTDLRRRINATKWPSRETVKDATQGVQYATMRELASYWATDYDWRTMEARLNALPQFKIARPESTLRTSGFSLRVVAVRIASSSSAVG